MDTSNQKKPVGDKIQLIKDQMPETYKNIQEKAKQVGDKAYALVRRGLRGEANCFYAFERGYVVGTAFSLPGINADVAVNMLSWGVNSCCVWSPELLNGTH